MTLGCLSGCLIGGSKKVTTQNDFFGCFGAFEQGSNMTAGGLVGGGAGAVMGGVAGKATSNPDVILFGGDKRSPQALRAVARYFGEEPEFLRSVGE
jgi:hypothetical protein